MNPNRTASNGAPLTVTLLGTGDAFASFGRSQSGYLIDAPGGRILMEAGPGLMPALKSNGIAPDSFDLLLTKPLGEVAHEGGLRLSRGSKSYEFLRGWISVLLARLDQALAGRSIA